MFTFRFDPSEFDPRLYMSDDSYRAIYDHGHEDASKAGGTHSFTEAGEKRRAFFRTLAEIRNLPEPS